VYSAIESVNDISYATAVGLIKWGEQMNGQNKNSKSWTAQIKTLNNVGNKIRDWFKTLKP
jgi:hypothetical protein